MCEGRHIESLHTGLPNNLAHVGYRQYTSSEPRRDRARLVRFYVDLCDLCGRQYAINNQPACVELLWAYNVYAQLLMTL